MTDGRKVQNSVFAPTCANAAHHHVSGQSIVANHRSTLFGLRLLSTAASHRPDNPGI